MIRLFSLVLCCAHVLTRYHAEGPSHERADHRRPDHGTSDRPAVGSPPGHGTGAQLFLSTGGDSRNRDPARRVLDQVSARGAAVPVGAPRGARAASPMTWLSLGESSWGCESLVHHHSSGGPPPASRIPETEEYLRTERQIIGPAPHGHASARMPALTRRHGRKWTTWP